MSNYLNSLTRHSAEQLGHYYAACQLELGNIRKHMKNPLLDSYAKDRMEWRRTVMQVSVKRIMDALDSKTLEEFGLNPEEFQPPLFTRDQ